MRRAARNRTAANQATRAEYKATPVATVRIMRADGGRGRGKSRPNLVPVDLGRET
ncbi:MAG: hypothetical protein R3C12_06780 [Planctomycetaceae bacterium]|nr:hypothetical protein [Planctomycetaceae bacterium]